LHEEIYGLKIIIRESALADLENICTWIANDSPANARSVAVRLLDAIEIKIASFPYIGRIGKVSGTREWVVRGLPYIIVYRVDDVNEAVEVLGVFHGAQNR
jgi:toxin ParE1/3/4